MLLFPFIIKERSVFLGAIAFCFLFNLSLTLGYLLVLIIPTYLTWKIKKTSTFSSQHELRQSQDSFIHNNSHSVPSQRRRTVLGNHSPQCRLFLGRGKVSERDIIRIQLRRKNASFASLIQRDWPLRTETLANVMNHSVDWTDTILTEKSNCWATSPTGKYRAFNRNSKQVGSGFWSISSKNCNRKWNLLYQCNPEQHKSVAPKRQNCPVQRNTALFQGEASDTSFLGCGWPSWSRGRRVLKSKEQW